MNHAPAFHNLQDWSLARLLVLARSTAEAARRASARLHRGLGRSTPNFAPAKRWVGSVALVGAGPGDPELLTLRAYRRIQAAEVVVYDRLVDPDILALVPSEAETIYVGKGKGCHSRSQAEINALIAARARAGRRVVRLKGGDPFVFGRGGEEQDYLAAEGIAVEVVPGITAATGCAAAAGIPLTHRDHANAVTFLTGHGKDGEPDLDWQGLVRGRQTLVVYMGLSAAAHIAARLIAHGMAPGTPAAVIENGTRPDQRLAVGSVADLAAMVAAEGLIGPAIIIIGDVVRAADQARDAARAGIAADAA
ncbi:MAG: uroporphyrinogen-III C-methyltransferase [Alphaproteobacteria bacterium]|nr:uroporphyrinogen-III C-methyltransferase [Alphaproteobacteria bacterium]